MNAQTTLENVKEASLEAQKRHETLLGYQQQRRRLEVRIPAAQHAVYSASQEVHRLKAQLATMLGGEAENMADIQPVKAALDRAELKLVELREERTILSQAEKAVAIKIAEADKSLNEAFTAVRELARKYFKTVWNRNRLWANNAEQEYTWRAGLLETILCRLAVGELRMNLLILDAFLVGGKVKVKVQRSFWYGKTADDRRALQPRRGNYHSDQFGLSNGV